MNRGYDTETAGSRCILLCVSRGKIVLLVLLATPLLVFGGIAAAWAIAGPTADASTIAPHVQLAGSDIGGLKGVALDARIGAVTKAFPDTPVHITTPNFRLDTTAGELGLAVDRGLTSADALRIGRDDAGPAAPFRWAKSLVSPRIAPLRVSIDGATAQQVIAKAEGASRKEATEPTLTMDGDKVVATKGTVGRAIDVQELLRRIPQAVRGLGTPITLTADPVETPPKISDSDAAALADRANSMTAKPLTVTYGSSSTKLTAADLRPAFRIDGAKDHPDLTLDRDAIAGLVDSKLASQPNPTGVTFDIVGGVPTPKPGADAAVCCGDGAPGQIVEALLSGKPTVALSTKTMTAAQGVEWAKTLGVKEVIGEFTTKHPCCPPRVTNIHRISDLTRGVLIAPGETFSANKFVGKRTAEKGFVSAPVIEEGQFKEDFGGGVSQWATTTFNAAFFGGIDIMEHKAHSIYISRYPFGREATLAYPSVDLKLRNNTPYGVVIWPTYTNTSITVQLWSTRFATGEQSAITKTSGCGVVKVTRTRKFLDGHTANDSFSANYNCNPPTPP